MASTDTGREGKTLSLISWQDPFSGKAERSAATTAHRCRGYDRTDTPTSTAVPSAGTTAAPGPAATGALTAPVNTMGTTAATSTPRLLLLLLLAPPLPVLGETGASTGTQNRRRGCEGLSCLLHAHILPCHSGEVPF